jgi:hypothetical protein
MTITGQASDFDGHKLLPGMVDQYLCWSRMQTEAGQPLDAIVQRKELERRAGNGLFFWGVGNAPAILIPVLELIGHAIPVVFSTMKSRPKAHDVTPTRVVMWRRYIGNDKIERPLPPHVVVTSRATTSLGEKMRHFALVCHSDAPLVLQRGVPFDPSAYRNASAAEAPVGASQVTALLRRTGEPSNQTDYEANITASLIGAYWVRLSDPREVSTSDLGVLANNACKDVHDWKSFTQQVRMGCYDRRKEPQERLL